MRAPAVIISAALLLAVAGCFDRVDYDVAEVAPEEHLGEDHDHDHEHGHAGEADHAHDHEHTGDCDHGHDDGDGEAQAPDSVTAGRLSGGGMHIHEPGERNHGTQWLFNQPWAAPFIWPKIVRDILILLALAGAVLLASRLAGRRSAG